MMVQNTAHFYCRWDGLHSPCQLIQRQWLPSVPLFCAVISVPAKKIAAERETCSNGAYHSDSKKSAVFLNYSCFLKEPFLFTV